MRRLSATSTALITLLAGVVAACAGVTTSHAPTPLSSPSLVASPSADPTTPPSASPSIATSPSSSEAVAYDESLLDLLPADIDGLTFEPEPGSIADIAGDQALALAADRAAFAVVADVESGELAATSVVHLRNGAFGDAFFRSYRDSYDAAACEPAGGKTGNAEAEIAGHQTFIGTCGSGAHTYHVYLPDQQAIVSVVSVGETRRFGERIVEGLRG